MIGAKKQKWESKELKISWDASQIFKSASQLGRAMMRCSNWSSSWGGWRGYHIKNILINYFSNVAPLLEKWSGTMRKFDLTSLEEAPSKIILRPKK
jgi:hypothetical protein